MDAERRPPVQRRCKQCGALYQVPGGSDSYLCPLCADASRKCGVVRERTCQSCGCSFIGYPRSKYCPDCQKQAKAQAQQRCRARRKAGKARPIGSTDLCERCGQPYVVSGGLQRYCPSCARLQVPENIRTQKRAYNAAHSDTLRPYYTEMRSGRRVCAVCGQPIAPGTRRATCSDACAKELRRRTRVRAQVQAGRADPARLQGPRGPVHPQSGVPGVHYHPGTGKWELTIKGHYIGLYDTVPEAAAAKAAALNEQEEP